MAFAPRAGRASPAGRSAADTQRAAPFSTRPFSTATSDAGSAPAEAEELRVRLEDAGRLGHDFARVGAGADGPPRAALAWNPGGAAAAPVVQRMDRGVTTTSTSRKRELSRSRSRSPKKPRLESEGEDSSSSESERERKEKRKERKKRKKEKKRAKREKKEKKEKKKEKRQSPLEKEIEQRKREHRAPYQEDFDEWVEKEHEVRKRYFRRKGYHSDEAEDRIREERKRSRRDLPLGGLPDPVPRHSVLGVGPSNSNAPYGTTVTSDNPNLYTDLINEGWGDVDPDRRQASLHDNLLDPEGREKITYGWSRPHRENDNISTYPVSGPRTLHISTEGTKALEELNSANTNDSGELSPRVRRLRPEKAWSEAEKARELVAKREAQERERAERKERERRRREEERERSPRDEGGRRGRDREKRPK